MVIKTTLDKLPELLKSREKAVHEAIRVGTVRGAERARALMVSRTPADTGMLRASWRVAKHGDAVTLVNDAPYAGIVEMGARPHGVNRAGIDALYEWARRHFGFTVVGARSQRMHAIRETADERDPFLMGVVWGIVKKLQTEGQKPTYFVRNSLDDCRELLDEEIEIALSRVASSEDRGGG